MFTAALPLSPAAAATTLVAYVANETSDSISVVDTATNTATATIAVGDAR